jgi:hypothetical protein
MKNSQVLVKAMHMAFERDFLPRVDVLEETALTGSGDHVELRVHGERETIHIQLISEIDRRVDRVVLAVLVEPIDNEWLAVAKDSE